MIYWWFSKKLTEVSDRKVQQSCGFIMKKLNLTKVVSSVAEGAGISFKMDRDRGKWHKTRNNSFFYSRYITSISLYYSKQSFLVKMFFIRRLHATPGPLRCPGWRLRCLQNRDYQNKRWYSACINKILNLLLRHDMSVLCQKHRVQDQVNHKVLSRPGQCRHLKCVT